MLCAISGEAPQTPVASRKSGNVFERRLIEAYIQENGKDPVTGAELTVDDLVELKAARAVKPRPPALTSIPALLSTFQNEWDALALETFTLKQHLSQLRQELSTALYNNDAAVRVIARLTRERDDARNALAKVSIQDRRTANGSNGDAMQVDAQALPDDVAARVDATRERLSKTRRKRPVPEHWVTPDTVQGFKPSVHSNVLSVPARALALDAPSGVALLGAVDGSSCTYSVGDKAVLQTVEGEGSAVNGVVLWHRGNKALPIVATSSGDVLVFDGAKKVAAFSAHSGPATGLSMHPSGDLLATVGTDKSICFFDLSTSKEVSRIITDAPLICCHFHPDGHLLAVGTNRGQIKIFDTKSQTIVADWQGSGPVQSLCFSENGFWLAAAYTDSSSVGIWDLRKMAEIQSLDFGGRVSCVRWDYTGQYLAGAGPDGIAVQYYDKASKSWSEPLKKAVRASAVEWGSLAKSLVVLTADGALSVLE